MKSLLFFLMIVSFSKADGAPAPSRVISLSPAITEIIFALNLQNSLVGVSEFSDFPEEAKKKTSVGPYNQPKIEIILKLKPDLVILPIEGPEDVKKHFDLLHIPYHIVSMRTLSEVGSTAEELGSLLGHSQEGKTFNEHWKINLKELFPPHSLHPKKIFIEVQKDPVIAAGKDTFLNEIVTKCGGVNTIEEKGYPHLSLEVIAKKHYDIIFLADYFPTPQDQKDASAWWASHSTGKVIALDPNISSRPGPRLLEGIKVMCKAINK